MNVYGLVSGRGPRVDTGDALGPWLQLRGARLPAAHRRALSTAGRNAPKSHNVHRLAPVRSQLSAIAAEVFTSLWAAARVNSAWALPWDATPFPWGDNNMIRRFALSVFRRPVRLRSRGLILLALTATLVALLPLFTSGGRASAGPGALPMADPTAPPPAPHHQAAPASAMEPAAPTLPRDGWTATASDHETVRGDHRPLRVLDGDPNTMWHSRWSPTAAALPHSITMDIKETAVLSALVYRPRATGTNGRIGEYAIHLSADGVAWGAAVATGTLADDATVKTLSFAPKGARFIRLTATTEAGGRGPFSSAGEINLLGDPGTAASVVDLPREGWTASATSFETARGRTLPPLRWTVIRTPSGTAGGHRPQRRSRTASRST